MLQGRKTFKTPYFSVTDKNVDKVQKMLDECNTYLKQLTDQKGF